MFVGSNAARSAGSILVKCSGEYEPRTATAMPTQPTAITSRIHRVERRLRSLIHSIWTVLRNVMAVLLGW
jgi:hypothetical protein